MYGYGRGRKIGNKGKWQSRGSPHLKSISEPPRSSGRSISINKPKIKCSLSRSSRRFHNGIGVSSEAVCQPKIHLINIAEISVIFGVIECIFWVVRCTKTVQPEDRL